jgi:hypothetical protein
VNSAANEDRIPFDPHKIVGDSLKSEIDKVDIAILKATEELEGLKTRAAGARAALKAFEAAAQKGLVQFEHTDKGFSVSMSTKFEDFEEKENPFEKLKNAGIPFRKGKPVRWKLFKHICEQRGMKEFTIDDLVTCLREIAPALEVQRHNIPRDLGRDGLWERLGGGRYKSLFVSTNDDDPNNRIRLALAGADPTAVFQNKSTEADPGKPEGKRIEKKPAA